MLEQGPWIEDVTYQNQIYTISASLLSETLGPISTVQFIFTYTMRYGSLLQ